MQIGNESKRKPTPLYAVYKIVIVTTDIQRERMFIIDEVVAYVLYLADQ